ncbi:MAG: hypothetical protein ACR2LC_15815 [Pyrinomonadaceae bacterium]
MQNLYTSGRRYAAVPVTHETHRTHLRPLLLCLASARPHLLHFGTS